MKRIKLQPFSWPDNRLYCFGCLPSPLSRELASIYSNTSHTIVNTSYLAIRSELAHLHMFAMAECHETKEDLVGRDYRRRESSQAKDWTRHVLMRWCWGR